MCSIFVGGAGLRCMCVITSKRSSTGVTWWQTLGNFAKATFYALKVLYGYLEPTMWKETRYGASFSLFSSLSMWKETRYALARSPASPLAPCGRATLALDASHYRYPLSCPLFAPTCMYACGFFRGPHVKGRQCCCNLMLYKKTCGIRIDRCYAWSAAVFSRASF